MRESLGPCPVCGGELHVAEYQCQECSSSIRGAFRRCDICSLSEELLYFVDVFLESEGNLSAVERRLGMSYPTVKARLAAVNAHLAETRLRRQAAAEHGFGTDEKNAGAEAIWHVGEIEQVPAAGSPEDAVSDAAPRDARLALLGDFRAGRISLEDTLRLL